ncbi:flavodoxin family protein [Clostridium sp. SM-530-WT-3G]|uniref:flavodoxin family protein n=1 Tax=Clostridium sp. SM-530-WT-3G TaxID=2725303 RepID=UPI00145C4D79|nr:flavodoxin family protein [Clostridium sp. SM-530-WT-3G]NME82677.1 flavodoxin family protein [Clostridium sp. SM-530-WT-3G]
MLLIHDLSNENKIQIESLIPKDSKVFSKDIDDIHPCLGCFKCWLKTPGRCIINDYYTESPKYIKQADKMVVITELRYGSYSPYIKRVIERSIGFLLPFFRIYNGEIHHSIRYEHVPELIFIGYSQSITSEEEKNFKSLVKANALNFGAPKYNSFIAKDITEIENIVKTII